jgi:Flp pilus assembly protein TadB
MVEVLVAGLPLAVLLAVVWHRRVSWLRNNAILMNLRTEEDKELEPSTGWNWLSVKLVMVAGVVLIVYCIDMRTDIRMVIIGMITAGIFLICQRRNDRGKTSKVAVLRQIAYELPLVMERIVMAVQAGHDILPALSLVVQTGEKGGAGNEKESQVLRSLREVVDSAEAGITLQSSLRMASLKTESTSLRHALLHIAVAHEQGGGVLFALSELADATQSYYQESVEEQIATLPVKATLPLVVVFAGLLVILLTSPIIQILDTTVSYGDIK